MSDDYLILSENFIALYDELTNDMAADPNYIDPPQDFETFEKAIRKYRPLLLKLARDEMTIGEKWWPF